MDQNLKLKKTKGLTLLEILISIGVFALLATTISVIFNRSLFVYRASTEKNSAAQQGQTAMEWLVRDIQSAYTIVIAEQDRIALVNSDRSYICYDWNEDDGTIRRQDCADPNYLLAEGVIQLSLQYYDINNEILSDPVADVLSLKTVEIDITTEQNTQRFRLNSVARFEHDPGYFWAKAYGGSAYDYLYSLQQTSDGGYILGGLTGSFGAGSSDFLLIKTDSLGDVDCCSIYQDVSLTVGDSPSVTVEDASLTLTINSVSPSVNTPSLNVTNVEPTLTSVCPSP